MTEIDPQKLMDLRNKWISASQAELDSMEALSKVQTELQRAHAEFIAYASKGEDGLADEKRLQENEKKIAKQVGGGLLRQRRIDEDAYVVGGVAGSVGNY